MNQSCNGTIAVVGLTAHGLDPVEAPLLANALYYLGAAALMVGRSENAVRLQLSRYKHRFDPPHYTKNYRRGSRKKREYRLLTTHDVEELRRIYPIYIKIRPRPE